MNNYWLTFTDGSEACCQGQNEYDAKKIAEKLSGKKVAGGEYKDIAAMVLPYPSSPVIWRFEHPIHGLTPTFCYTPKKCAGKTACPGRPSCTE